MATKFGIGAEIQSPTGLSVCLSVTLLQIASSFLFLNGIEPFLAVSSKCGTLQKRCSSIFDLDPLTPKIYSPKVAQNREWFISRLAWQIDRRCLDLLGVFGDGRFNGTMQNVVGPTLVAMATTFGLGEEI